MIDLNKIFADFLWWRAKNLFMNFRKHLQHIFLKKGRGWAVRRIAENSSIMKGTAFPNATHAATHHNNNRMTERLHRRLSRSPDILVGFDRSSYSWANFVLVLVGWTYLHFILSSTAQKDLSLLRDIIFRLWDIHKCKVSESVGGSDRSPTPG